MTGLPPAPAIELVGIDKRFGAVHANRAVDLSVARGTIHGIVGENGAGKSTLMSILYGFYEADAGEIRVDGRPARIASSRAAIAHGIGMVHQHFMLVETLSVLDNVLLGAEGGPLLGGRAEVARRLAAFGRDYGLVVDPRAPVGGLPVGLRQRVEILKALVRGARVLILDEPTAVLSPGDADRLFALLARLKGEGKTVLFITHKLREILAHTDRVSVMRQGAMVATLDTAATDADALATAMVGRRVATRVRKAPARPGATRLAVRDLVVRGADGVARVDRVSLDVRAGEIVGIAGVSGNGQSELIEAIAGVRPAASGAIEVDGVEVPPGGRGPRAMRARGLVHVPEDRHRLGLVTAFEACESAMLGFERDAVYGRGPLIDRRGVVADMAAKMEAYDVRPRAPRLRTANLSGGNQQKIVLAREFERDPGVVLAGQPTRGVDIGAIEFIHARLVALRDAGKAILVVSVELDEILALADRVVVMCAGRVTGERDVPRGEPDEAFVRDLGLLMAGIDARAA